MCVPTYVSVGVQESQKKTSDPGAGIVGACKPLGIGVGTETRLCNSSRSRLPFETPLLPQLGFLRQGLIL